MSYICGGVLLSTLTSPHHMGLGHSMGMGMGAGLGVGIDMEHHLQENETYVLDSIINISVNENISDTTDGNNSESTDFNMVMGFGASFGILGFIISVLALRRKPNDDNNNIYIEPITDRETEPENYDSQSIEIIENNENNENIGYQEYETISDTLYELSGETPVYHIAN